MNAYRIPFNKPSLTGKELDYIRESVESGKVSGDGMFSRKCHEFMEKTFGVKKALLTTSCTHALEMAAFLIDLKPGDEVIVPSYTFVSTVNAFVLRGAVPVFIDIRPDTLNLDETLIPEKITRRTKAIFVMHYAGVGCKMDTIMDIAHAHNLVVVEDAAQGINAQYKNQYLGAIAPLGTYSFHETKNYICGEGGALLINEERFIERAEIIREKGTNRSKFFRGEVDKYTWVDIGSSYLPSDILAAYLYAQFEHLDEIQEKRKSIYRFYYENLKDLENEGKLRLPIIPPDCSTNYHLFYILLPTEEKRDNVMNRLKERSILSVFHYVPLHLSPMGRKFGYQEGDFPITENLSSRLLRLPFYNSLTRDELDFIISSLRSIID